MWKEAPCYKLRSYFAIFGNLFGFKNFGKLVAADNIFNSLFGLLQVRHCWTAVPHAAVAGRGAAVPEFYRTAAAFLLLLLTVIA